MRLFGLIGYPLGHSYSKRYFTDKFSREGLVNCMFEAFPIPGINQFPELLNAHPNLEGICVTIPYKEQVLEYVQECSPEVEAIGAANNLKRVNGKWVASNTDIVGFELSLKPLLKSWHTKALVLGTGGAAKAICYVLNKLNIDFVLVTRNPDKHPGSIGYNEIDVAVLQECTLIINCSPIGIYPNESLAPDIPYELLNNRHLLYDLVYRQDQTQFLELGAARGATTKDGYEMLLLQAEENWRIWNSDL